MTTDPRVELKAELAKLLEAAQMDDAFSEEDASYEVWADYLIRHGVTLADHRASLPLGKEPLAVVVEQALLDYRCLHQQDEGGNGQQLVDALSVGPTIEEAQEELSELAGEIAEAVIATLSTPALPGERAEALEEAAKVADEYVKSALRQMEVAKLARAETSYDIADAERATAELIAADIRALFPTREGK